MGQKFKKIKNDVLEISLDQWNERVRPWLGNDICLFAFFPRAMLLLLESLLYLQALTNDFFQSVNPLQREKNL